jgi:hypothetical protein
MCSLFRQKVLAEERAAACLRPVHTGSQGLPRFNYHHSGAPQRPQFGTRPIAPSLLLGEQLRLDGSNRFHRTSQSDDRGVVGVRDAIHRILTAPHVVAAGHRSLITHVFPPEGLCFEAPGRPVGADRPDLTPVPL